MNRYLPPRATVVLEDFFDMIVFAIVRMIDIVIVIIVEIIVIALLLKTKKLLHFW